MFQWIRLKVRNAVLAGMNDAVEVMIGQGANDNDQAETLLNERLLIQVEKKKLRGKEKE